MCIHRCEEHPQKKGIYRFWSIAIVEDIHQPLHHPPTQGLKDHPTWGSCKDKWLEHEAKPFRDRWWLSSRGHGGTQRNAGDGSKLVQFRGRDPDHAILTCKCISTCLVYVGLSKGTLRWTNIATERVIFHSYGTFPEGNLPRKSKRLPMFILMFPMKMVWNGSMWLSPQGPFPNDNPWPRTCPEDCSRKWLFSRGTWPGTHPEVPHLEI